MAKDGRRFGLPNLLIQLAKDSRRFSLPNFLIQLAEYSSKLPVFTFTSELIYNLVKLYSFLFIYLTSTSSNTIDSKPPSLKIPTYFYITIFK